MKNYHNEPFVAIIGDIRNSKQIENRAVVQDQLSQLLDQINKRYKDDIASIFTVSMGDGIQGLLLNKKNILQIILEFELKMFPVEFRFGIGFGDISTNINKNNSLQNDDPAYHRARKMIDIIEKNENKYGKADGNILICSSDDEKDQTDQLVNATLSLATVIKSKWTERQIQILLAYLMQEENQYKTAEALGIGQSSVSKTLSSMHYYSFKQAYATIQSYIK